MSYVTLIIIGILVLIPYILYVGIISKKNKAFEALSTIDVQLKQRLDLVPNILKVAKKFMEHEASLLTEITTLRSKASEPYDKNNTNAVREHFAVTEQLSSKMGQMMLNVENYPTLKSDQTMLHAMQTYNEVEAQITAARRFYNSSVTALNNAIQIFPGNMIAQMLGVQEMPFFEAEEAAKASIDADQFLK